VSQTDWSGGSGQSSFFSGSSNKYFTGSGVDTSTTSGSILLSWASTTKYSTTATGTLESSTFDTGTSSNFLTLSWNPVSQPALTGSQSVKFQFATKPSATSSFSQSDYVGPDGTTATYFTTPGASINSISNGNEFARYMAYLTTNTATVTPSVNDITFAYSSGCVSPGQVLFQALNSGATYTLTVSATGYTTQNATSSISTGWQVQTVSLQ
jgi:hypothetical protein